MKLRHDPPSPISAGTYTFELSAWNANGESVPATTSDQVQVAFSSKPRFWNVQGSRTGATLRIIRPDTVAEPGNLRYKVAILRAGDSGSTGTFRQATLETHTGDGTLESPAVIDIQLSEANFGAGVTFAQVQRVPRLRCAVELSCAVTTLHMGEPSAHCTSTVLLHYAMQQRSPRHCSSQPNLDCHLCPSTAGHVCGDCR